MSTAELYMSDEEIADFIRETKKEPQWFYGDEGREYGVCPFITFYVYHHDEDFLPLADKMIRIHRTLEGMIDTPYQMVLKSSTETWFKAGSSRLPSDLHEEARKDLDHARSFWIQATDMESPAASACWAIDARVQINSAMRYSFLKITFRHSWYLNNKARWHDFVLDCLRLLEPEQCYSGFEIGTTGAGAMGAYESDVMERICADYFYGLDIDHPGKMGYHGHRHEEGGWIDPSDLGAGLRAPTWCFLLSPHWLKKLGKDEATVRRELDDPRIEIIRLPRSDGEASLWIRLGELALYPVEEGVPELPALANALIRPVRCDELELSTLDRWDDDPNPSFDFQSSQRWMARFDADSDWPSPEKRRPTQPQRPEILTALPGQPCPESGEWFAHQLGDRKVFVEKGQPMPGPEFSATGQVIWHLRQEG